MNTPFKLGTGAFGAAGGGYFEKIKSIFNSNLVLHYKYDDASGMVLTESISGINGTYAAPTSFRNTSFKSDTKSVLFTGVNSYNNLYSANFNTAVNKTEGTIILWFKMSTVAQWNDDATDVILYLQSTSSNRIMIHKNTAGGLVFYYVAGGTIKSFSYGSFQSTKWMQLAISWSKSGDKVKAYVNGVPVAPNPLTSLGTWTGNFNSAACIVGSYGYSGALTRYLSSLSIVDRAATDAEMLSVYPFNYDQLVFIGDSRVALRQFPTRVSDGLTKNSVARNVGISGYTVFDMNAALATNVTPYYKPGKKNIAIILGGVNDCVAQPASVIYSRLQTLCENLKAAGFITVLCNEIDAQDAARNTAGWHSTILPALNTLLADGHSFADYFCDLYSATELQDATNVTYFYDAIHLTLAGNVVQAAKLTPIIESIL